MKRFLFFITVVTFMSCAPSNIGNQARVSASLENTYLDETKVYTIATNLHKVGRTTVYRNCKTERIPVVNSTGEHFSNQIVCKDQFAEYFVYQGILIVSNDGELEPVEIKFLSPREIDPNNIIRNAEGSFVNVRITNDVQVKSNPGPSLEKVFLYVEN